MDPISAAVLLASAGAAGYVAANHGKFTQRGRQIAEYRRKLLLARRRQHQVAASEARKFQIAILVIASNPDFRRVASAVRAAANVPAEFKRRQFYRFRQLFIRHFRDCVRRGTPIEAVEQSLEDMVTSFELEAFEADYLRRDAAVNLPEQTRQATGPVEDSFQQRLNNIQQEHEQRVQAIREMTSLDDDTREQLLESEERRYQSRLFENDGDRF